jgi:hypothetical protein
MTTIRPRHPADLDACVALMADTHRLGWQLLASADYTVPDGRVFVMFRYAAPD